MSIEGQIFQPPPGASRVRAQVADATTLSTDEWEERVGEQVRRLRLGAGLDQAELADSADVSIGALRNLERGKGSTLKTLVRVTRALGRENWFGTLAPAVTVSPIDVLRSTVPARTRVYRPRGAAATTGATNDSGNDTRNTES